MTEAPRWRLQEPHYLNVPGTEWDHKEMNQATKKQITKHYKVPLLLDPKEPSDWNYPEEIIVAHVVEGLHNMPRDIIFEGPPTLAMEPLNQAAMDLSHKVLGNSKHPMNDLPANGSTEAILDRFTRELEAIIMKAGGIPKGETPLPNQQVPEGAIAAMQVQLNEALEKIAKLERLQAQGDLADAEALPDVEITDAEDEPSVQSKPEPSLAEHAQRAAEQVHGIRRSV